MAADLRSRILYAAPGAGLGHLVRACALCLALQDEGLLARVVTNSLYARGLRRLTGCAIDFIPEARWVEAIPTYVAAVKPELVVTDTFPWGWRGEWRQIPLHGLRFVLLARRLKVQPYLKAAGIAWENAGPPLERVILSEPLGEDYLDLLTDTGAEIHPLPGRISFPSQSFATPIPPELQSLLEEKKVWLVVHSGPRWEVDELLRLARNDLEAQDGGVLAAVLPQPLSALPCRCFEYFPAARLYSRAWRIVTGGGYNSLAEMVPWQEKHLCQPFPRNYDDQAGRLAGEPAGRVNGAPTAARLLASWLHPS